MRVRNNQGEKMKPQKNMVWKVRINWQGVESEYETEWHVGKFIELLKETFKGCEVVERWQEPR